MITIIAAASENNALGKNNDLVWRLPDDSKRFKKLTTGHTIIMGRKTFESFPNPLPNRTHIVITKQKDYVFKEGIENCIATSSLKNALAITTTENEVFIVGGGQIYEQSMGIADKIELTRVHGFFEADAFFPNIDLEKWKIIKEEFHPKDEKHNFEFTYQTFLKK